MGAIEWRCPRCGAPAHEHGPNNKRRCLYNPGGTDCEGFLCECEIEDDHGTSHSDPCREANCYCCGWGGVFPVPPHKLAAWEKKALAEGWEPPHGWSPAAGAKGGPDAARGGE